MSQPINQSMNEEELKKLLFGFLCVLTAVNKALAIYKTELEQGKEPTGETATKMVEALKAGLFETTTPQGQTK